MIHNVYNTQKGYVIPFNIIINKLFCNLSFARQYILKYYKASQTVHNTPAMKILKGYYL